MSDRLKNEIHRSRVALDILTLVRTLENNNQYKKEDIIKTLFEILEVVYSYNNPAFDVKKIKGDVTALEDMDINKISSFYDITVLINFSDKKYYGPTISAFYDNNIALFSIEEISLKAGDFPERGVCMVLEWIAKYQCELLKIWDTEEVFYIPPLD